MINIYSDLFNELERKDIFYCSWKSNHGLSEFLEGEGDLDLCIKRVQKTDFESVLRLLGFIKVNSSVSIFPYVDHFIGFDVSDMKMVHLHVYFKIITGESNSKNYILPLDSWIQENTVKEREINTLTNEAQLIMFLIRHYIKIGSLFGLLLVFRDRKKYSGEFSLLAKTDFDFSLTPDFIPGDFLNELWVCYRRKSVFKSMLMSLKLKLLLLGYRRRGGVAHLFFKVRNTFKRLMNKVLYKRKKFLDTGFFVSVCGLDGSGKSSAVQALFDFYSRYFSVKIIHMGRPSPTVLTFVFWLVLKFIGLIRHSKAKNKKTIEQFLPKNNTSHFMAVRYLILAYERYRCSMRAQKLLSKGYIVISDRFPSLSYGKMDSPRISMVENPTFIYSILSRLEKRLYLSILPCDSLYYLSVPVDVAIERNANRDKVGKETDNEIRARYIVNDKLEYQVDSFTCVDATIPLEELHAYLKKDCWKNIG
jgi:thymidylate kinase